jgi:hypothetical protein
MTNRAPSAAATASYFEDFIHTKGQGKISICLVPDNSSFITILILVIVFRSSDHPFHSL